MTTVGPLHEVIFFPYLSLIHPIHASNGTKSNRREGRVVSSWVLVEGGTVVWIFHAVGIFIS